MQFVEIQNHSAVIYCRLGVVKKVSSAKYIIIPIWNDGASLGNQNLGSFGVKFKPLFHGMSFCSFTFFQFAKSAV